MPRGAKPGLAKPKPAPANKPAQPSTQDGPSARPRNQEPEGQMKTVKLELTPKEAEELYCVLKNGYGDGDYYGLNNLERFRMPGWKRDLAAYLRGVEKLQAARLNATR